MKVADDLLSARLVLEEYFKGELDEQLYSPSFIAEHLEIVYEYSEEEFLACIDKVPNENLGDILIELPQFILKEVVDHLPASEIADAIEELESDDATDLIQTFQEVDEEKAKIVFDNLEPQEQQQITRLISYEENEAGAFMQTEAFVARLDERVKNTIARLKRLKNEGELENIHQLFLVDNSHKLLYGIDLQDLITFDFTLTFHEALEVEKDSFTDPHTILDHDDISKAVGLFDEHDLSVLPIVDENGKFLGRITGDDIHDIIQESATEQIYNLAGVDDEAEDEATLYEVGKSRAIWLFVNLLTAVLASSVISLFDDTIQAYVALAILMPIVASMGGNAGTQTLTVVVRKLALGEIDYINAKDAILKEVTVSVINGLLFALIIGVVAYLWFKAPLLGIVIALSMIINLFFAGFFGAFIPLALKKLEVDPAVGSTVILTTVTDVVGFFSFLGLAKWILL